MEARKELSSRSRNGIAVALIATLVVVIVVGNGHRSQPSILAHGPTGPSRPLPSVVESQCRRTPYRNQTKSKGSYEALKDLCEPVSSWCGTCCIERASRAGSRVESFRKLLAISKDQTVHFSVVGNSVARQNNFGTTRFFVDTLQKIAPDVHFSVDYGEVAGGFSPKHLMQCGAVAGQLSQAQVVIVEWSNPMGMHDILDPEYEVLIRRFINLPMKPIVIYVSHGLMGDFSTDRAWINHPDRDKIGEPMHFFEAMRTYERRLADHYGLPFIDSSAALHSMVAAPVGDPCSDIHPLEKSTDLIDLFLPDCVHQNELYNQLQSCLMAHAIFGAEPCSQATLQTNIPLPKASGDELLRLPSPGEKFVQFSDPAHPTENPTFCMSPKTSTLELDAAGRASGWERKVGGHGGRKIWLAASLPGARFLSQTRKLASHYKVEVYTHHDLPLGLLKVVVNGSTTIIDPCCAAPHCPGTGLGRGLYKEFRVPTVGEVSPGTHVVEFEMIAREPGDKNLCAENGSEISLVGLMGFLKQ